VDLRTAPAALPALGILAGVAFGLRLAWLPVPLALALLAAAVALGGGFGRLVVGLAAGLLAAAIGPGPSDGSWPEIDPGRPVVVVGEVVEPWRRLEWGWRSELRTERVRQGQAVLALPRRLAIELAGEEPPPPMGSRLRARGYLGRPAGYANRLPVPPGPWRLRIKTRRLLDVVEAPGWVSGVSGRLRARVEEALAAAERAGRSPTADGSRARAGPPASAANGSPDEAAASEKDPGAGSPNRAGRGAETTLRHGHALVRALVLGDPSELPPRWRRGLRRTGLAHLLAVSGLHAGLVAGVMLLVAAPLPRPVRIVLALVAVAGYLALVGPRPSMLRASGMALIAGVALLARRGPASANALAVVAGGLALARPELVAELGFRLTVAATAGIVFLAPRLEAAWSAGDGDRKRVAVDPEAAGRERRRRAASRWLVRGLAATVGAQLASLPFALPVFHLTSWAAPLLNVVAVPYTALALAVCLGWTALALVSCAAAAAMVPLLDALAMPFGWPAAGPPAAWGAVAAAAPAAACWAFAVLAVAWLLAPRRRLWLVPAVAAGGWWCCAAPPGAASPADDPAAGEPRPPVSLTLLDVGQGDAILLRDGGRAVLVDGGGWRHGDFGGRVLLPALLGEGVRRLDAVLLTHPDSDHCHGLEQVSSYLPVTEVWLAPQWAGDRCADELAATPGARVVRLAAGGRLRVGRWRLAVLHPAWPRAPDRLVAPGEHNRLSLVLRAAAAGRCAVLTGDLDRTGERAVVARGGDLGCDLLKVGHHGSKTSTGPELLAAVRPRLALVSAGRGNPYGHPAAEVVARLERAGVTLLRTDRQGLVRLEWREGGPLRISTPAAPP